MSECHWHGLEGSRIYVLMYEWSLGIFKTFFYISTVSSHLLMVKLQPGVCGSARSAECGHVAVAPAAGEVRVVVVVRQGGVIRHTATVLAGQWKHWTVMENFIRASKTTKNLNYGKNKKENNFFFYCPLVVATEDPASSLTSPKTCHHGSLSLLFTFQVLQSWYLLSED